MTSLKMVLNNFCTHFGMEVLKNTIGPRNAYGLPIGFIGTAVVVHYTSSLFNSGSTVDEEEKEEFSAKQFCSDCISKTSSLALSSYFSPGAVVGSTAFLTFDSFIPHSSLESSEVGPEKALTKTPPFSNKLSTVVAVALSAALVNSPIEMLKYCLIGASPLVTLTLISEAKKAYSSVYSMLFQTLKEGGAIECATLGTASHELVCN